MSVFIEVFIITIIGYSLFNRLIANHGLAIVTPYTLLIPVSGLFFGWWVYYETLTQVEMIGSVLILFGLALLMLRFSKGSRTYHKVKI